MLGQHAPPGFSVGTGAGDARCTPCFHQNAPVGLLFIAGADHVDFELKAKERTGHRKRAAPLTGARLGCEPFDALLFVVIGLGHSCVRLMAAGWTDALILVVDASGGTKHLLEPASAVERRRPPEAVDVTDRFGDGNPTFAADFLLDERHWEERSKVVWPNGLAGSGMQWRGWQGRQVGREVIPVGRQLTLAQHDLGRFVGHGVLLVCSRLPSGRIVWQRMAGQQVLTGMVGQALAFLVLLG